MKQRDIYLADLNPTRGREQKGTRPVVIISGNAMNDHLKVSIVCPLSSKIKNYAGCVVITKDQVNNLERDSEIITFQIRTISQERLIHRIGEITKEQMERIKSGLNDILTF